MLDRALLDSALDCIISMDTEGRIIEFNPAAERVFGYCRADVIGKELASLIIPPPLRDRHRAGLKRYLETGEGAVLGKRLEVTALRADGSEITVELAITALQRAAGLTFTAYLRDITDRNRGEEASRRLAAIIESSDDAIVTKDLNGIITSWNAAAERLFGYKPEEIIGKSILTLIPPDRQHEEPKIIERIRSGDRIDHYETVRQRKDGRLFDISVTVSPLKDREGRIIGASKIARDITERVQTEGRRRAQYSVANLLAGSATLEESGPRVVESIAAVGNWVAGSIWLRDREKDELRCIASWHRDQDGLAEFAAATNAMVLGKNQGFPGRIVASGKPGSMEDLPNNPQFSRAAAAAAANLGGSFGFPLQAEGEINGVLELFSREPVPPDDDLLSLVEALGSQIGLFVRRREIEAELKQQKEAAESANAAKDQFLATLSHELRTPLTPILIWAGGMINDPSLPPEVDEGLRMVCRNVELEARLIDDLLDLTRIARGKLRLHLRKSDAHDVLTHAMEIVRDEISSRDLNLSVELNAADHMVLADASRLQQVFWNVLRNASKFTPRAGAVTVRTLNPGRGALHIEISDTGIGIEPSYIEKIFDAFEQGGIRREGLGLGLAISKAIVEMHHGSIRAFSDGAGKGARFVIDLQTAA
ncbi:MAG TPA: PAS domain S-box protein [Chthoniobacterales bacterium]|jgi:two-component system CheB/CheR fusion protein|nr:PAS domain S-box protein [Chthoniobacterales bacterium]